MPDAIRTLEFDEQRLTAGAAVGRGEVWQINGEAAVYERVSGTPNETAAASGERAQFRTRGKFTLPLTDSITILAGGRVYWDHSANKAHYKKVNDRDFYVGRAVQDSSSGSVEVDLNVDPPYDIDALRDGALIVPVGTQAVGAFGYPIDLAGAKLLQLTSTNEAQKIDILSVDGFSKDANAIVEMIFRVTSDGAGGEPDFNIGVANGTHATDADSITESVFCHLDGNNTNINLESDDGTTEVAATDTTYDYTEGSAVANRVEVWMDFRNPADVQIYVNGVLALTATVFNVNVATGPFFLLAHLEKTASATVYAVVIDALRARFQEQ